MPAISDLSVDTIYQGNTGERWIVTGLVQDESEIFVTIKKLKVQEQLILEK